MTYQEAIEQMESLIRNSASFHHENGDIWEQDIEALNIAKKALEKQIPKKPEINLWDKWCECPCCGGIVSFEDQIYNHCPDCGQAINSSEEEE